jgi:hypothetical protein
MGRRWSKEIWPRRRVSCLWFVNASFPDLSCLCVCGVIFKKICPMHKHTPLLNILVFVWCVVCKRTRPKKTLTANQTPPTHPPNSSELGSVYYLSLHRRRSVRCDVSNTSSSSSSSFFSGWWSFFLPLYTRHIFFLTRNHLVCCVFVCVCLSLAQYVDTHTHTHQLFPLPLRRVCNFFSFFSPPSVNVTA